MLEQRFLASWWLVIGCYVSLSLSDYYLTLAGSRLYARGAVKHIGFSGSYELIPHYQPEIDALRKPGFSFFLALFMWSGLLVIAFTTAPLPLYAAFTGAVLLVEVPIHSRHIRNLLLFGYAAKSQGLAGRIEYERWLVERLSAFDLLEYGVLFGITSALTGSYFLLGGSIGCVLFAYWGHRQSRDTQRAASRAP
jgi:hypothetical protein